MDTSLFLFLNGLHCEALDVVMWYATKTLTWLPLYLVALYVLWRTLGWRGFLLMLLGLALCVLLADRISSGIIKPLVARPRPSHALGDAVHVVRGYRGGAYGFVSSHAANMFAIAIYTLLIVRRRWYTWLMLGFAAFVSYTRIYLGVHYPTDILCGAILGAAIGWGMAGLFRWQMRKKCELVSPKPA